MTKVDYAIEQTEGLLEEAHAAVLRAEVLRLRDELETTKRKAEDREDLIDTMRADLAAMRIRERRRGGDTSKDYKASLDHALRPHPLGINKPVNTVMFNSMVSSTREALRFHCTQIAHEVWRAHVAYFRSLPSVAEASGKVVALSGDAAPSLEMIEAQWKEFREYLDPIDAGSECAALGMFAPLIDICRKQRQRLAELATLKAGAVVPDISDEDFESISIMMQENGIGSHREDDESFRRIVASTWAYAQGARSISFLRVLPDLAAHLCRQREFSLRTFGPGQRTNGVIDHIRKELVEIEQDPQDAMEWIDVVILGFDGALRAGHDPEFLASALVAKQMKNESRTWPDWRTSDPKKAIEHVRATKEAP